jgi:hypothetical protein
VVSLSEQPMHLAPVLTVMQACSSASVEDQPWQDLADLRALPGRGVPDLPRRIDR